MSISDRMSLHSKAVISYLETVRHELSSSNGEAFKTFTKYLRVWVMRQSHDANCEEKYIILMISALRFNPGLLEGLNQVISPNYRLQFSHSVHAESPYYILASEHSATLRSIHDETTDSRLREAMETDTYQQLFLEVDNPFIQGYQACLSELLQVVLDSSFVNPLTRKKAYKSLLALSKRSIIPPSIFITESLAADEHPEMGGGFSDIYQGTWNGQTICCRVLRMFASNDRAALYRDFCKEIITWRQLSHPNILPFMGASMSLFDPRYTFIAPWLPNGCLKSYLKDHPTFDRFLAIYDIVEGLSYLHSQTPPVYHKDVKASNVLVTNEGVCILADFGLTSIVESQLIHGSPTNFAGSIAWTAPEVLDPQLGNHDLRKADIYSLACTIYEVITGLTPWADETRVPARIISLVATGKRPNIPKEFVATSEQQSLWWLVELCWTSVPVQRPCIELVKHALLDIHKPSGRPLPLIARNKWKSSPDSDIDTSKLSEISTWLNHHQPYDRTKNDILITKPTPKMPISTQAQHPPSSPFLQGIHAKPQPNIQRIYTPITPSNQPGVLPAMNPPQQSTVGLKCEFDANAMCWNCADEDYQRKSAPKAGRSVQPTPTITRLPTPSASPLARPRPLPSPPNGAGSRGSNRISSPLQQGLRPSDAENFPPNVIRALFQRKPSKPSDLGR